MVKRIYANGFLQGQVGGWYLHQYPDKTRWLANKETEKNYIDLSNVDDEQAIKIINLYLEAIRLNCMP